MIFIVGGIIWIFILFMCWILSRISAESDKYMLTDIQEDRVRLWVEDLRKAKKQVRGRLFGIDTINKEGYCCLGRMCVVYKKETKLGKWTKQSISYDRFFSIGRENDSDMPPNEVVNWFGISKFNINKYATMNDTQRLSFKDIAAQVEADYLR